jgi:hypothetical protein
MVADDPDDDAADLPLICFVLGRSGVGLIGQAQVCAQNVYAGLSFVWPVVSEAGERVGAGQTDRGRLVAKLLRGRGVAGGELDLVGAPTVALGQALFAVCIHPGQDDADKSCDGDRGSDQLQDVHHWGFGRLGCRDRDCPQ